jgi:hypothetical protein
MTVLGTTSAQLGAISVQQRACGRRHDPADGIMIDYDE